MSELELSKHDVLSPNCAAFNKGLVFLTAIVSKFIIRRMGVNVLLGGLHCHGSQTFRYKSEFLGSRTYASCNENKLFQIKLALDM